MDISHPAAPSDATPVNVLLVGLGSIGAIYAYLLEKVPIPPDPTSIPRHLPKQAPTAETNPRATEPPSPHSLHAKR